MNDSLDDEAPLPLQVWFARRKASAFRPSTGMRRPRREAGGRLGDVRDVFRPQLAGARRQLDPCIMLPQLDMLPDCLTKDRTGGVLAAFGQRMVLSDQSKDPSLWALEVGGSRSRAPVRSRVRERTAPTRYGARCPRYSGQRSMLAIDAQTLLGPVRYSDTAYKPGAPSGRRTLTRIGFADGPRDDHGNPRPVVPEEQMPGVRIMQALMRSKPRTRGDEQRDVAIP